MKRIISILLILAIISSTALFAQGSAEKAPSDGKLSGKVTMWTFPVTGNDQVIFTEMITEFNKAYPDVTVDVQVLPWNGRYEKMLTAIAGGNPPNVVYLNDFQIPMFAHTNNLVPMNEVFTESELGIYKTGAKNAASVGGTLYAIPVLTNSLGYLYNVDLFVEAGLDPNFPPETWTDLEVAIAKLTKKDANGNIVQWGARFDLNRPSPVTSIMPFIWQAGGNILNSNGEVIIDSAATKEALAFIKGLFEKGYIQKSNITGGGVPFSSGKIGIDLQREPNDIKKVLAENPSLNFLAGPILKNKEKIGYVTCGTYAMFSKAGDREATKAWVKFIANKQNTTTILSGGGFMSPRTDIAESDYMKDPRSLKLAEQNKYATGTGPMNVHYSEILSATGSTLNSIILGTSDMNVGLKDLSKQITQILNN